MQTPHFVSIRKLEVIEIVRFILISNGGVSIRRAVASDEWRVASRSVREESTKNSRIFAIRKMEALENAAVIWISSSRFAIRNDGIWRSRGSGVVLPGPVVSSKLRTTDGNIVVTSCQVLMSGDNLTVPVLILRIGAWWKGPGLKPIQIRDFAPD